MLFSVRLEADIVIAGQGPRREHPRQGEQGSPRHSQQLQPRTMYAVIIQQGCQAAHSLCRGHVLWRDSRNAFHHRGEFLPPSTFLQSLTSSLFSVYRSASNGLISARSSASRSSRSRSSVRSSHRSVDRQPDPLPSTHRLFLPSRCSPSAKRHRAGSRRSRST